MILHIDTTKGNDIEIIIRKGGGVMAHKNITAKYSQAEKLLPLINKVLTQNKLKLKDIKRIKVNNKGGGFTALRVGVATANALGYALGIEVEGEIGSKKRKGLNFNVVEPVYDKEPNITIKKSS